MQLLREQLTTFLNKTHLSLYDQAEIVTGPIQMALDITNKCMMNCLHCFNRSKEYKRDELNDIELRNTIEMIVQTKPQQICLCGGEPLMRKDISIYALGKFYDNGILPSMVTNGYLMNKQIAAQITKISNVINIQVSLDGHKAEIHDRLRGKKGAFDKSCKAIRELAEAGLKPSVAFTPTRFNCDFFEEFVEFAIGLGVVEIRVQPIMYLGNTLGNMDEIMPTQIQYRSLVQYTKKYIHALYAEALFFQGENICNKSITQLQWETLLITL